MIRTGLLLSMLFLCAACSRAPVYTERYYALDGSLPEATPMDDAPHVLVEPFEAHGLYTERQMLYRRPEGQGALERYGYVFWTEQPARMLTDGLHSSLRRVLGDDRVHSRSSRVRARFVIRPRLRRLEMHLHPDGAKAEFAADFMVTDEARQPRFVFEFAQTRPLPEPTAAAFAQVSGALAAQATRELIEHLTASFAAQP
jgi:ABC-type uncharacterized transport system auxiliary subunit